MARVHGPAALLPAQLKALCAQLFPRLRLIPELSKWQVKTSPGALHSEPARELWEFLVQGHPLLVLSDLLGATSIIFDGLRTTPCERLSSESCLTEFLRRVQLLEYQGRLSHGEGFRVDDFLGGTASGFMKVLRTVQRVLNCLEATYPGVYELPHNRSILRENVLQSFLNAEYQHLALLQHINECAITLCGCIQPCPIMLDCLLAYTARISVYQSRLVWQLETTIGLDGKDEQWEHVFSLDDTTSYVAGIGAYQSLCSVYPSLCNLIEEISCDFKTMESEASKEAQEFLAYDLQLSLGRLSAYPEVLSTLISLTHPVDKAAPFTSLCTTHFKMRGLWQTVAEMGQHVRTAWTVGSLKKRAFKWRGPDPADLGAVLIDDCIYECLSGSNQGSEAPCWAFLFEASLLLCKDLDSKSLSENDLSGWGALQYPVEPWDLGPAVRGKQPLNLHSAIPVANLKLISRPETDALSLELVWYEASAMNKTVLVFRHPEQLSHWISVLSSLTPESTVSLISVNATSPLDSSNYDDSNDSEVDDYWGVSSLRRTSKPRPWSLIGRKEKTPASSLFLKEDRQLPSSPSVLPKLFYDDYQTRSPVLMSPVSIPTRLELAEDKFEGLDSPLPLSPSPDSSQSSVDGIPVLDLTGRITRQSQFPSAHGGYADVWNGLWDSPNGKRRVAVKVLRGKIYDGTREEKMKKRLRREIRVWQRLNHPNIIPLYGTCSDFGHYISMVCPWMDNGNVRKYIEANEDALKLTHRLKLLCQVAAGLSYLHSYSVVHGDLTGSNILINEDGQACLCDFGLSNVVEDLLGESYFTSSIGGAVRWAAPELYTFQQGGENQESPHATRYSDIYSFGCVALEILSGEVPYDNLRSDGQVLIELSRGVRPPRPHTPYITDEIWGFIKECWNDLPRARPGVAAVISRVRHLYEESLAFGHS